MLESSEKGGVTGHNERFSTTRRFHQRSINEIKGGSICLEAGNGLSLIPRARTAGLDSLDQSFRQVKDGSTRGVYGETSRFKFFSLPVPRPSPSFTRATMD